MAHIVLGLGISHTPQMSLPSENWAEYAARDATAFPLIFRRQRWEFDDLAAARADDGLADQITPEVFARKYAEINTAVAELAAALEEAKPDAVVVIGDDHHEMYTEDSMPTFAVYWGEQAHSFPPDWIFPQVQPAAWALFGEGPETYPGQPELGRHLIVELNRLGFDVAQLRAQPEGKPIGHGFILVRNRLMDRDQTPLPIVPFIVNTYFEPNRPTPQRCWDIGRALAAAIEAYPEDLRVAVIASGGLSHFVVDEQLDRKLLSAIGSKSDEEIAGLDLADFSSGTSEGLCWVIAGGACAGLKLDLRAYVPGYRTEAGTGCGMTAVIWR